MRKYFVTLILLLLATTVSAQNLASFQPAATSTLAVTNATGNVAIATGTDSLLVTNSGTKTAFWRTCKTSTCNAVTTDTPALPGSIIVYSIPRDQTYFAAITAGADTTTAYATPGWGSIYSNTNASGDIVYQSAMVVKSNTADGADTMSLCLSGGGACDVSRGALLALYGNENGNIGAWSMDGASGYLKATGSIYARGSDFTINPQNDANRAFTFAAASDTAHTLKFGDGSTANQTFDISSAYADAADSGSVCIGGGGACNDATRGASVKFNGEQVATGSAMIFTWATLAATGTVIGDAALLTVPVQSITGADAAKGVKLPAAPVAGQTISVYNTANAVLKVWPGEAGDQINAKGAGINIAVPAYGSLNCAAISAAQWQCGLWTAP